MTVRTGNLFLLAIIPFLLVLVYIVETVVPEVTTNDIESARLSQFFGDRMIVHISDQHLVSFGWRERMTISRLEDLRPDLIIMTGDYLESYSDFSGFEDYIREMAAIAPIIATPGNNDYCCMDILEAVFKRHGVTFLKNETILLRQSDDSIYLVGLEDNFLWKDDYFRAVEAISPEASRIVLGHAPGISEKIDPAGVELILSGHLHGGQIMLPIIGSYLSTNRVCFCSRFYASGLYDVNGVKLFSNRGLGTSIIPLRLFSRPEIAVLKFVN